MVRFNCQYEQIFVEDEDWWHIKERYILTADLARRIALYQNSSVGMMVSHYIINTLAIMSQDDVIVTETTEYEYKETDADKVSLVEQIFESRDMIDMSEVAKILNFKNFGRNKIFELLRNKRVLRQNNEPYQRYVERGHFKLIEMTYEKPNGKTGIKMKTVVSQKGVNYIKKIIEREIIS